MKKLWLILLVTCISFLFAADNNSHPSPEEIQNELISIVKPVLSGEIGEHLKSQISAEAYLINGNKYESIFEVLNSPVKRKMFIEGGKFNFEFIKIRLTDKRQSAYMVFKTTSGGWHSVYFEKNSSDKWLVTNWHKS